MPFHPASSLAKLIETPVRPGEVVWIGTRPARRAEMQAEMAADLEAGKGMVGDRYRSFDGARQVTLIQAESLVTIASHLGREIVRPQELRRNIVVKGINLLALKGRRFRIGAVCLETSGECHPCSRLEATLGAGGYNAVRGLGGITARVVEGGKIEVGDRVEPMPGSREQIAGVPSRSLPHVRRTPPDRRARGPRRIDLVRVSPRVAA